MLEYQSIYERPRRNWKRFWEEWWMCAGATVGGRMVGWFLYAIVGVSADPVYMAGPFLAISIVLDGVFFAVWSFAAVGLRSLIAGEFGAHLLGNRRRISILAAVAMFPFVVISGDRVAHGWAIDGVTYVKTPHLANYAFWVSVAAVMVVVLWPAKRGEAKVEAS